MKTTYWIIAVVVVLIVIGLIVRAVTSSNAPAVQQTASSTESATQTTSTSSAAASPAPASPSQTSPAAPAAPTAQHFTVNGNDETADLKQITVPAGTPVSITFGADAGSTYHGGLDFRSSVISTGTIAPGNTKTISFTADHSFSFTPYWPATNIAKPYTINVTVK